MSAPEPLDMDDDAYDADDVGAADEAFERQYQNEHSWELLEEDEHGRLKPLDHKEAQRAKRRKLLSAIESACIRKGMIRYLELVVDMSMASCAQDLRPNRLAVLITLCKNFVREYFDQNPLSQLGIIVIRNGVAERLTELSGSPESQIAKLSSAMEAAGTASLQNALDMASTLLNSIPPYGHREVLILFAALSSCDPGSILDSIKTCQDMKIRVSVVGLAAEVFICKKVSEETGGTYAVALHQEHLEELVMSHATPPPVSSERVAAELVRMGFPQRSSEDAAAATFAGPQCILQTGSYTCPKCKARVSELPCSCHVCGLTLISSPHLARSYHHLFPVKPFVEVQLPGTSHADGDKAAEEEQGTAGMEISCFGCFRLFTSGEASGVVVKCTECSHLFCFDCDTYIHETLHNCPGCQCKGV